MTKRISLCINVKGKYGVKPSVIADVLDNNLVAVQEQWIKTENSLILETDSISIWNWDDSLNKYSYSDDVTSQYSVLEIVEPGGRLVANKDAKTFENYRRALKDGLKIVSKTIDTSLPLFISVKKSGLDRFGFVIPPKMYAFAGGKVKLTPKPNENPYAQYGSLPNNSIVSNGSFIPGTKRNFAMTEAFAVIKSRLPLIDLVTVGMKCIKRYLENISETPGVSLSKEQINAILKTCDSDFRDYADSAHATLEELFSDSDSADELYRALNGITKEGVVIERYLQRYPEFKEACCESLRSMILEEKNVKLESVKSSIIEESGKLDSIKRDVSASSARLTELRQKVNSLSAIVEENKEIEEKNNLLKAELADSKRLYLCSIFGEGVTAGTCATSSTKQKLCRCTRGIVGHDVEKTDFTGFCNNLRFNLKQRLDDFEYIKDLTMFIVSAIMHHRNIVVSNDFRNCIAESISAALDGMTPNVLNSNGADLEDVLSTLKELPGRIVTVNGILSAVNYADYFSICRQCDKILIISCDDVEVLRCAPSELWNYSIFLDLSDCIVNGKTPKIYSIFENIDCLECEETVIHKSLSELVSNKVIKLHQANLVAELLP